VKKYIALFEAVDGGEGYGVVFPDFPGCISAGETWEEAVRMAHEALAGHVALMERDRDTIPAPRTLSEIKSTWEDWPEWEKATGFLIGCVTLFPIKPPVKRVNITLDENLLDRIDSVTDNRSAFLASAVKMAFAE
jgi:predicted RNase H-like HicB family nuclease